jgi:hypothetical protein
VSIISLADVCQIIRNKLQGSSKYIISKDQNDFNPRQGYVDSLFIVEQQNRGEEMHITYIDLY